MKKIEDYYLTDEEFEKKYGMSAEEFRKKARLVLKQLYEEVEESKKHKFIYNEVYEEAKKYTSNLEEMGSLEVVELVKKHNPSLIKTAEEKWEAVKEEILAPYSDNDDPFSKQKKNNELKDQDKND